MKAMVNWFEIPVNDMERAQAFYQTVLGIPVVVQVFGGVPMGFFPYEGYSNAGALVLHPDQKPSDQGTMVYFNCGEDLTPMLERVEPAGGKVGTPKTAIGENMGFFAWFFDPEGNRVGLYSDK